MKYKLVIFDLDGTILDTLDDLTDSLNNCLAKSKLPLRTKTEVESFLGNGIRRLVQCGVPEGTKKDITETVYHDFLQYYQAHCEDKTRPYDGILELLKLLRTNGFKTAVVSNKADAAVQKLCEKFFNGLFDVAIGERENVRKKPEPDSVNEVLKQLKVSCNDAVYIGDSEVDIQTAKNANMHCITVEWGFRKREFLLNNGAQDIVTCTKELYEKITK